MGKIYGGNIGRAMQDFRRRLEDADHGNGGIDASEGVGASEGVDVKIPSAQDRTYHHFRLVLLGALERCEKGKGTVHAYSEDMSEDAIWHILDMLRGGKAEYLSKHPELGFCFGQVFKNVQEVCRTGRREKVLDSIVYLVFAYMQMSRKESE